MHVKVVAVSLLFFLAQSAVALDPLQLVKQAGDRYYQEIRGIIGYRATTESAIKSPVFNQVTYSESFVVLRDGLPVRSTFIKLRIDGKEATPKQLQEQENKTNASFKEGKNGIDYPYEPRNIEDYRFTLDDASKVPAGITAVRFTSPIRDGRHGHGVMFIDQNVRVTELRFTPNKVEAPATQGSFRLERGEAGAGIFGIKNLFGEFKGSVGPIKGSMTFEQTYSQYRRFKSLEDALSR